MDSHGFSAKVIADSIGPHLQRVTTLQLRYPRWLHGELMTHRVFSRNAMSSRAVPVKKMLAQVLDDPALTIHVGANQPGMQARAEVDAATKAQFYAETRELAEKTAEFVRRWSEDYLIHKQVANRFIEPWQWMHTIVTATEWDNFWKLRCHPDAEPNMQLLAELMHTAYKESVPTPLGYLEWHLPYVSAEERQAAIDREQAAGNFGSYMEDWRLVKLSVARCARVSFNTHDGAAPDPVKDIELHDKLVIQEPAHASPAEHQCRPDQWFDEFQADDGSMVGGGWSTLFLHGNLRGFIQYRKLLERHSELTRPPLPPVNEVWPTFAQWMAMPSNMSDKTRRKIGLLK